MAIVRALNNCIPGLKITSLPLELETQPMWANRRYLQPDANCGGAELNQSKLRNNSEPSSEPPRMHSNYRQRLGSRPAILLLNDCPASIPRKIQGAIIAAERS